MARYPPRLGVSNLAQVADPNVPVVLSFECTQRVVAVLEHDVRSSGKLTDVLIVDLDGGQR